MTSSRWMILVCFSLISVFGTGETLTIILPEKSVSQSSLPAIINEMTKAISDLNASHKKLLLQQKGSVCSCASLQKKFIADISSLRKKNAGKLIKINIFKNQIHVLIIK
ncbi:hypothetical protein FQA47_001447 [Oryzias melastigma]|uniref:Uncharacterized protein n=1 Tax=Oryzias melastigma TaxID=30732 RepID=A0A834FRL6_ORYME|nr:hypothetical protein FQA47_001447 [Oryzias melastigma]